MQYDLGIDVSRWQGQMNWQVAKDAGIVFAIIKMSEGSATADPTFTRNVSECVARGIRVGYYHFWRPGVDPDAQFDWIESLLARQPHRPELGLALDCETADGLSNAVISANLARLSRRILDKHGEYPTIYTSQSFWSKIGAWSEWAQHPLWVANWTTAASPAMPKSWQNWKIWQYEVYTPGSKYGAQSAGIDLNRMARVSAPPPPPPGPVETIQARVKIEIAGATYAGDLTLNRV